MFYTSVDFHGGKIYYRGYDDNKRISTILGRYPGENEINLPNTFNITENQFKDYETEIHGYLDYLVDSGAIKYYNIEPSTAISVYGEHTYKILFNYPDTYSVRECLQKHIPDLKILNDIDFKYKTISAYSNKPNFKIEHKKIKIGFIDIECEAENGYAGTENPSERINAISIRIQNDKMYLWCLGKYTNTNPDIYSFCFENESALLKHFIQKWRELDLDVISGWNINRFDIPYIVRRLELLNISSKTLSPFNIIKERKTLGKFGGEDITYNLLGIQLLDYMELYQKHIYEPRASYSLNNISNIELGEGKLDYSEYGNLHSLYKNNFQKFIDYNIRDTNLVLKLEEKLKLIELVIYISYMAYVNYEDIASPVRTWDAIIYNELKKDNIVIKDSGQNISNSYPGAYVKPPKAGIYKWVASFDVNSLYPNLIRQINISPETIINDEYLEFFKDSNMSLEEDEYRLESLFNMRHDLSKIKERDLSLAASGNLFKRNKIGFLPTIVGRMYNDRVKAKTESKKYEKLYEEAKKNNDIEKQKEYDFKASSLNNEQMALKILLNSEYGAMANKYFRWYDLRLAKSITMTGQVMIRFIANRLNEFLNKELNTTNKDFIRCVDTDSNYVSFNDVFEYKAMQSIDDLDGYIKNTIEPFIIEQFKTIYEYMNHFDFQIMMKRECIADKALFLNSKKRYVLNVLDKEGIRYTKPKLKIMGLEVIKSSTPEGIKKYLLEVINVILNGDKSKVIDYIEFIRSEYRKLLPEEIAASMSVSYLNKYTQGLDSKGLPINSRAAINHNQYLKKCGLEKKYQAIKEGSKIKFVFLNELNPTGQPVIAFENILPSEFQLNEYIDYDLMFEKTVIKNIQNITDDFNWNLDVKFTIDDLL